MYWWCRLEDEQEFFSGTSLGVQWLRLSAPNEVGLGSIPGQGTGSYMLQIRVHLPKLKISRAITKISHIQINIGEKMVLSWKIKKWANALEVSKFGCKPKVPRAAPPPLRTALSTDFGYLVSVEPGVSGPSINSCCMNEWLKGFRFYPLAFRHSPRSARWWEGHGLQNQIYSIPACGTFGKLLSLSKP